MHLDLFKASVVFCCCGREGAVVARAAFSASLTLSDLTLSVDEEPFTEAVEFGSTVLPPLSVTVAVTGFGVVGASVHAQVGTDLWSLHL